MVVFDQQQAQYFDKLGACKQKASLDVGACLEVSANDVGNIWVAHFDSDHTPHAFNCHDSFVDLQKKVQTTLQPSASQQD